MREWSLQKKEERAEAEEDQKAEAKAREDAAVAAKESRRQDRTFAAEIAAASATQTGSIREGCAQDTQQVQGLRRAVCHRLRSRSEEDRQDDQKAIEAGEEKA